MKKKIIILGAGPCGLSMAYLLALKGEKIELYESRNLVGGLGGSESVDGMIFDYGPHIYHTDDKEMKKFWLEHFGDLLVEKHFFSKNYKDGILYDYPLSYESINKFPTKIKKEIKKELKELNPEKIMRANNFKEVVTAIVGPTLQNLFFEGYSKKLWGIPTSKMSAKWAPKRIQIREKHSSFWHNQFSAAGKYGSGAIMNRMAENIKNKGSKIYLNYNVNKLITENNEVKAIHFTNNKKIFTNNSIILSTLPITKTSEMLGYKSKLEFNAYILIYIILNKKEVLPKNVQSIYFANDDNYFHRVTEQKKYSDIGYPKNKTLLCFEISVKTKPELLKKKEEDLCRDVFFQFCHLGYCKKEEYEKGFTRLFPSINPIMKIGYEQELAKTTSFINKFNNLYSIGGAAEYSYGDMQVMFAKARDAVDLLTSNHYEINKNLKMSKPFKFNSIVKIGTSLVGGGNPTLIIAELGINHQGSNKILIEMLNKVKSSGCDYAKLQTYSINSRVSNSAKSAKYADKTLGMEETLNEMFERVHLNNEAHEIAFEWSKKNNLPIISTAFDEKSVDMLLKYNIDAFKIASFDSVNLPLIKYIASKKIPIILSTGMCGMTEIEEAIDAVASQNNPNLILLHCISAYPTDPSDVNLKVIKNLQKTFNIPVGYSDHTIGNTISLAAISLGAHVLEKHFTLSKKLEGSDHILSANYNDLKYLVESRGKIFNALGDGIKRQSHAEFTSINTQRKSLFTKKNIKAGEKITLDNVEIKGPGHGLLPKYLNLILGKKFTKNLSKDQPITWNEILKS
jgi:sialic acid synthase SpsE/protoporphyrinogen oxidase